MASCRRTSRSTSTSRCSAARTARRGRVLAWGDPRPYARPDRDADRGRGRSISVAAGRRVSSRCRGHGLPQAQDPRRRQGPARWRCPRPRCSVLQVSFVDVQQGDGDADPDAERASVITIDGGENQLFARFLAGRLRDTSAAKRRRRSTRWSSPTATPTTSPGSSRIHDSETAGGLPTTSGCSSTPKRVFHNGLVKRPTSRAGARAASARRRRSAADTVVTGLDRRPARGARERA